MFSLVVVGALLANTAYGAPAPAAPAYGGSNNMMGVQACGVALSYVPQVSSFCTSFVGGVPTKTVTVNQPTTRTVLQTSTFVLPISYRWLRGLMKERAQLYNHYGPVHSVRLVFIRFYATDEDAGRYTTNVFSTQVTTIAQPTVSTVTVEYLTVTATETNMQTANMAGATCDSNPQKLKRAVDLDKRFGYRPIGQFAPAIISQACSSYVIKTQTTTTTKTDSILRTNTATITTRVTKPTPTSTLMSTTTSTVTSTPPPLSITTTYLATLTTTTYMPGPTLCNTARGLTCTSGSCVCSSGQKACGGVCGATFTCPGTDYNSFGLTDTGFSRSGQYEGDFVCAYGFGSSDPVFGGYTACYFNSQGRNVGRVGAGNPYGEDCALVLGTC